ncbi:MAG TPA: hypothetical protein GX497_08535 [Bacillus bacterium]|nr:hypothetical protein [Bacillus sp. (in: firmicutes)]
MRPSKWRLINWDNLEIVEFTAFNPFKFMKKHVLRSQETANQYKNFTLEFVN